METKVKRLPLPKQIKKRMLKKVQLRTEQKMAEKATQLTAIKSQINSQKQDLSKVDEQINRHSEELRDAHIDIEKYGALAMERKKEYAQLQKQLAAQQRSIDQLTEKERNLQLQNEKTIENNNSLNEQNKDLSEQNKTLNEQHRVLFDEIREKESKRDTVDKQIQALQTKETEYKKAISQTIQETGKVQAKFAAVHEQYQRDVTQYEGLKRILENNEKKIQIGNQHFTVKEAIDKRFEIKKDLDYAAQRESKVKAFFASESFKDYLRYRTEKEISKIDNMIGTDFEAYVVKLLTKLGYTQAIQTKKSGDFGLDVIAYNGSVKVGVQCKVYSNPVSNGAIQEAYSGSKHYHTDQNIVVTNSSFTNSAKVQAKDTGVKLCDRERLKKIIYNQFKNEMGAY
ncbi:restriction endonuclease [Lactiplantibacillus plajomi]